MSFIKPSLYAKQEDVMRNKWLGGKHHLLHLSTISLALISKGRQPTNHWTEFVFYYLDTVPHLSNFTIITTTLSVCLSFKGTF